jgi:hypothetical protein
MTIASIVEELDAEIARLREARRLLSNDSRLDNAKSTAAAPKDNVKRQRTKKRTLSAETREKIAEAQRKRWAAQRKAAK